jgi:hypothetical protein
MRDYYRETPPALPIWCYVHRGMIGYEEEKKGLTMEAKRHRLTLVDHHERESVIARAKTAFRYVDVEWIAGSIQPWDLAAFKRLLAQEQHRFLREKH